MKLKPFSKPLDQSKKDEILDAAQSVFAEVGFKEATVRQICKKAKANVCLVSYYFDGKEGLYRAVFERVYADKMALFDNLLQNVNDIQTPEEFRMRLRVHLEQLHGRMVGNINFFKLIQREVMEGMPRLEKLVRDFIFTSQQNVASYIVVGQKKKFVKKELDPQMATSALMIMLTGFIHNVSLGRPDLFFPGQTAKEIPENINKVLNTLFFDGVMQ